MRDAGGGAPGREESGTGAAVAAERSRERRPGRLWARYKMEAGGRPERLGCGGGSAGSGGARARPGPARPGPEEAATPCGALEEAFGSRCGGAGAERPLPGRSGLKAAPPSWGEGEARRGRVCSEPVPVMAKLIPGSCFVTAPPTAPSGSGGAGAGESPWGPRNPTEPNRHRARASAGGTGTSLPQGDVGFFGRRRGSPYW